MTIRKIWLKINGANRMLVCDTERDSLADVLRRIGLTGTKIGCNCGQCGACSVILNGKVVRSCIIKMSRLEEYSEITTIEGVGTPNHLHPLQLAWIKYGGVQCGFCTPGFIVSAKGLLDTNLSPSREDVREWFKKHQNVCRCTGYKPLVDAVMAAAGVLRGENSPKDLEFEAPENGSIYGSKMPKPTAVEKVTGLCDYGDDIGMKMPAGTLHLAVVQPKVSHANILNIDFSEAEKMPGVVKVITARDIKGTNQCASAKPHPRAVSDGKVKPILCDKKIFRYGDVVAVVAAETREEARAAAEKVRVELKELPATMTAIEAVRPDALRVHDETPNVFCENRVDKGEDVRHIFPEAPHVVEGSFSTQREPHLAIEPDVLQAYIDEVGRVTVQCKSQNIHGNRKAIAAGIGVSPDMVRIIENPTGASFGYAMSPAGPAIVAVCTMALNRPVTLTMSYPEHQLFSGKRAGSFTNVKMACDQDGKITALEYEMLYDNGAYPESSTSLIEKGVRFIGNPYNIPNINAVVKSVLCNDSFGVQYRGYGSPQCYAASEQIMDMMAEKLGMDRFEFRYKNIARPGDLTVNCAPYHEYPMEEMMEMMRPYWDEAKAHVKSRNTPDKKHGISLVWGGYHVGISNDNCFVELELNKDDTVTVYNSWEAQGQGADTGTLTHTYEALRPLGLRLDQIKLVQNDTAFTPETGPASGSRSHYMAGNATIDAANKLMTAMKKEDGTFRTYEEMAAEGIPTRYEGKSTTVGVASPLDINNCHGDASPEANYLLMLVEVEVDVNTGAVKVLSNRSISDIGVVGNQLAVEGQAYGAFSHSIGYALKENFHGNVKKEQSILGAGIPTIGDVPDDMQYTFHVTPRPRGPHGSSGCAEGYQSVGHAAILNAIYDAVGVRIYNQPATPDKIKAALEAKNRGEDLSPVKFDMGDDFYQTYDYLGANPV